jgi:hypothetical protein
MAGMGPFSDILDGEVYKYYADGEWRASASGKAVAIVNPTTRQTQYRVQGAALAPHSSCSFLLFPATWRWLRRSGGWLNGRCGLISLNSFDTYEAEQRHRFHQCNQYCARTRL